MKKNGRRGILISVMHQSSADTVDYNIYIGREGKETTNRTHSNTDRNGKGVRSNKSQNNLFCVCVPLTLNHSYQAIAWSTRYN